MQQEEWRQIEGYAGFEVSNTGKIRSLDRVIKVCRYGKTYEKVIKGHQIPIQIDFGGYQFCTISIKNKGINLKVHRMVAQAFIPNYDNLPQVNHIDGNKQNNNASNLEWCTALQNQHHAWATGLQKPPKGVNVRCIETGELFESISEASRKFNIPSSAINANVNGRFKSTHHLHFERIK